MSTYDDHADRFGEDQDDDQPSAVTCKRCGKRGLEWIDTGMRWALLEENGRLHNCGAIASPDDFDDVTQGGKA